MKLRYPIIDSLRRGVTVIRGAVGVGSRGATEVGQTILYRVVTRLEIGRLREVSKQIKPKAFVTTHGLADVEGGLVKRRVLH